MAQPGASPARAGGNSTYVCFDQSIPRIRIGQDLKQRQHHRLTKYLSDEDQDHMALGLVVRKHLHDDPLDDGPNVFSPDMFHSGRALGYGRMQLAVSGGDGEIEILGLGDGAFKILASDESLGLSESPEVIGEDGDASCNRRPNEVRRRQSLSDVDQGGSKETVNLVDEGAMTTDPSVPR